MRRDNMIKITEEMQQRVDKIRGYSGFHIVQER